MRPGAMLPFKQREGRFHGLLKSSSSIGGEGAKGTYLLWPARVEDSCMCRLAFTLLRSKYSGVASDQPINSANQAGHRPLKGVERESAVFHRRLGEGNLSRWFTQLAELPGQWTQAARRAGSANLFRLRCLPGLLAGAWSQLLSPLEVGVAQVDGWCSRRG